MSTKKQEERNEKVIRGLMKLPPNRRCINCNSLGPQYVCTNFWTFVCIACSGVHREFTHRVKSVSMAKFTSQEVEALQRGGNQRAREIYLKDWDLQRQRFPDSSKVDKVREFITNVYVDRKYAGGKVLDKPPRDAQSLRNHEDETRRASSYHSFSQSPPYEYQYEDRKYGKQVGALSRKPGSDRGYYEAKISSLAYSPGRLAEQMYEDRFANEGSVSRVSDYSVSSTGDPFRSDTQSPNFQGKPNSPPMHHLKHFVVEDMHSRTVGASEPNAKSDSGRTTHTQRTASLSSFGSFDGNSVNSGSFIDVVSEPEQSAGSQLGRTAAVPSVQKPSVSANAVGIDLFNMQVPQQSGGFSAPSIDLFENPGNLGPPSEDLFKPAHIPFAPSTDLFDRPANSAHHQDLFKPLDMHLAPSKDLFTKPADSAPSQELFKPQDKTLAPSVDFFAGTNHQSLAVTSSEQKPAAVSFPQNEGWATFDLPQATVGTNYAPHANMAPVDQVSSTNSSMQWPSVSFESHMTFPSAENQWHGGGHEVQPFGLPTSAKGGLSSISTDQKSTNPFDLSYDSTLGTSSVLLNMSSLQAALPDPLLAPSYAEDFNQPWFPPNTNGSYIPAAPQGGLAYMTGEAPTSQFPSIPSQGSVASLGGNPFA